MLAEAVQVASVGTVTKNADGTYSPNVIAQFPHTGNLVDDAQHADLCGDGKEEVIVYNESKIWIFSNGTCDLDAALDAIDQISSLASLADLADIGNPVRPITDKAGELGAVAGGVAKLADVLKGFLS